MATELICVIHIWGLGIYCSAKSHPISILGCFQALDLFTAEHPIPYTVDACHLLQVGEGGGSKKADTAARASSSPREPGLPRTCWVNLAC